MNAPVNDSDLDISVIVPAYNESASLQQFLAHLEGVLDTITQNYEVICIDDGSMDETWSILCHAHDRNPRIKGMRLSRNFGKEAAITAGMFAAQGRAIIPMDADHQHPPEVVPQLVEKWRQGHDVVLAVATDRAVYSWPRRVAARLFYRLMNWTGDVPVPDDAGDFRLMDRRVVEALRLLPERTRFMKGIFAWLGFDQAKVPYQISTRSAGDTKWNTWSLWNFAIEGIVSFSTLPLRMWSYLGICVAIIAIIYAIYIALKTMIFGIAVPGYASLMTVLLFFNGLIMISLGILGEYVGRIFVEVKQRPLYLIRDRVGIDERSNESTPFQ